MKSKANGLMGDLESIKALLEENDISADSALWQIEVESVDLEPVQEATQADQVPILTDALPADADLPEELTSTPVTSSSAKALDAIVGSDFHDATAQVMARARGLIEQHPNQWSPQQTDELSDALRVRIDDAVQEWISAALASHAGELQQRLVNAVHDELARHLESFDTEPTQT